MRFVTYRYKGADDWGILKDNRVVSKEFLFDNPQKTLMDYIVNQGERMNTIEACYGIALDQVELKSPIHQLNRNVFCIGKNYYDHLIEMDPTGSDLEMVKKAPVVFTKATTTLNDPNGIIPSYSEITDLLDYEVELGVIIGKDGHKISEDEAMDYVFGYTIINDVTARDIQKKTSQWFLGKSLDKTCPMGPVIMSKDEIEDVQNLKVYSKVNDEIRQENHTSRMMYTVKQIISILSKGMTLKAGDVIATGTPSGVGVGFTPPRTLKSGDVVEVGIENIGILRNKVV